jgi:hypothetical protein
MIYTLGCPRAKPHERFRLIDQQAWETTALSVKLLAN